MQINKHKTDYAPCYTVQYLHKIDGSVNVALGEMCCMLISMHGLICGNVTLWIRERVVSRLQEVSVTTAPLLQVKLKTHYTSCNAVFPQTAAKLLTLYLPIFGGNFL